MDKLQKYVCKVPFRHIEIFEGRSHLCCASWLPHPIHHTYDENGNENIDIWNHDFTKEIRQSMLDGSYKFCSKELCPHLNTLINTNQIPDVFVEKDKLPYKDWDGYTISDTPHVNSTPASINFTFDWSCNLKCPSCRLDFIMADGSKVEKINTTIDFINKFYAKDVRKIFITGSGDPFASKSFRKFLQEFNPKLYPNIMDIHLSTNGNLFNKKQWDFIKNAQPFIKTVEISIDAATKNTYENITRVGGKWDVLMENLDFIGQIDSIRDLRLSFVVQQTNYKEMFDFVKLIHDKFKNRIKNRRELKETTVYFGKIAHWEAMNLDLYKKQAVWMSSHPEFKELVEEIKKVYTYQDKINIQSNMTDLLLGDKTHLI